MGLLAPGDQQKLREVFSGMEHSVQLLFFSQAFGCDTCAETRQVLDELPPLSDKITIEEVNLVLEQEKARQYGIERAPAVALVRQNGSDAAVDSRIRFLGTPAGYEFASLVQAVLLVGGRASGLSDASRRRIEAVDRPVTMQVFTTPT
jgi:alkyl hydroperoxide reductase subunit AhpF